MDIRGLLPIQVEPRVTTQPHPIIGAELLSGMAFSAHAMPEKIAEQVMVTMA